MAEATTQTQPEGAPASAELNEFDALLSKEFKPKTDEHSSQAMPSKRLSQSSLKLTRSCPSRSIRSFITTTSGNWKAHGGDCTTW
jgi:hypothetical protein